jgi:putative phage-type endonuclease
MISRGFKPHRPAILYVVENAELGYRKIGIVNETKGMTDARFKGDWKILFTIEHEDGRIIKRAEQVVLSILQNKFDAKNLTSTQLRTGFTETIHSLDKPSNRKLIRVVKKAFRQSRRLYVTPSCYSDNVTKIRSPRPNALGQKTGDNVTGERKQRPMTKTTITQEKIASTTGAKLIGQFASGTDEWLALRAGGIGGSEVAAICGFSKWESFYSLWARKTGAIESSIKANDAMEWGTRLEPVILDKFEDNHPELTIHREVGTWKHGTREYQITNPDGIYETATGEYGIIEVKTAMYENDWEDGVPRYYATQVQWYLETFGLSHAYVVVLFHGNKYMEYEINANTFEQEAARERVELFMEHVKTGTEPDFDGANATYETMRAIHPLIDDELEVEIDNELVTGIQDSIAQLDAATEANNLAKVRIMSVMGTAKKATNNGRVVAQRQARGGGNPFLVIK